MLADKADVRNPMRVTISFGDVRDKARFISEIKREMDPVTYLDQRLSNDPDELTISGIRIRLL